MKVKEMYEIVTSCVPVEGGFINEDTGEFFTDEALQKLEGDFNAALDFLGVKVMEMSANAESKKQLAEHYRNQAKIDENRIERLKFFLGFLTRGQKTACEHITIWFAGKQERLVIKGIVPKEFQKAVTTYKADTALIRAELEKNNSKVAEFAYIDTRKKASIK